MKDKPRKPLSSLFWTGGGLGWLLTVLWQHGHPIQVKLSDAHLPWTLLLARLITPLLVGILLGGIASLVSWIISWWHQQNRN